jgi:hypothetical protein
MILTYIPVFVPLFICINLFKYVLFTNNNHISTSLIQFIIVNLQINTHFKKYISNYLYDIIIWLFFGISNQESINYLDPNINSNTTNYRFLIENEDTTYEHELSDYNPVYTWINDNKLVTTIMLLTITMVLLLIAIFIVKVFQTSSYHIIKTFFRKKNIPFMAIITQVAIISYCNLTTIAISQFKYINEAHVILSFLALCIIIFITFGLPITLYYLLETNRIESYTQKFQKKFGCLYLQFNKKHYKFITMILLKQFVYAILLVINIEYKLVHNIVILFMNSIYLCVLLFDNPYYETHYQKQSTIVELCTIFIIILNFVIYTDFSNTIKEVIAIIALILQGLIIITYISIFIYVTLCKEKIKLISAFIINNDNIQIEMTNKVINNKLLSSPLNKSTRSPDIRSSDIPDWVREEFIRDQMFNNL